MIIHPKQDHHVRVHKNVAYLNQFKLGSRMAYCWFFYGISISKEASHENLGMFFIGLFGHIILDD